MVLCSDFNEYVCKYSAYTPADKLLIEYLGYAFATLWQIPIPLSKFVRIRPAHVVSKPINHNIQIRSFDIPTIGSLRYPESKEIDRTLIASWKARPKQLKRLINKDDLLKIGLFDLWMANEDRNHNNYNLLAASYANGVGLLAIDHEKCFNSGAYRLGVPPYQLSCDESILSSELIPLLFSQNADLAHKVDSLVTDFTAFTMNCKKQLQSILLRRPQEWSIRQEEIQDYINNHIFVSSWCEETKHNFRQYISAGFVNK